MRGVREREELRMVLRILDLIIGREELFIEIRKMMSKEGLVEKI